MRGSRSLTLVLCAWGVLAFGAVYPWGYWPLAAGAAGISAAALTDARIRASARRHPLLLPLAVLFGAIGIQLVPLPAAVLEVISPSAVAFLRQSLVGFEIAPAPHPLSLNPGATAVALALGAAFAALMVVTSAVSSEVGARKLAIGLVGLGFVVALIGIVQRPMFDGKIYGFWEPQHLNLKSFGPFVNPNHFAGWMAMCLSLALGLVSSRLATSLRGGVRGWRDCVAWASSTEANGMFMLMIAAATMGLALVLALSRSGILCLILAAAVSIGAALRRHRGARRGLAVAFVSATVVGVLLWAGPATVAREFETPDLRRFGLGGRLDHWSDAATIVRAFPVTGAGVNAFAAATLVYQKDQSAPHTTAAHNEYLQILADGGLLVAVPATWAAFALIQGVRRRFRESTDPESYWIRLGAVSGLLAIALQSLVEFSLQIPGVALLFACLCGIALHRTPGSVSQGQV